MFVLLIWEDFDIDNRGLAEPTFIIGPFDTMEQAKEHWLHVRGDAPGRDLTEDIQELRPPVQGDRL
jgi:hypothetical protein